VKHVNIYDRYKSGPSLECKLLLHSMTVYNILFIIVCVACGKFCFASKHRITKQLLSHTEGINHYRKHDKCSIYLPARSTRCILLCISLGASLLNLAYSNQMCVVETETTAPLTIDTLRPQAPGRWLFLKYQQLFNRSCILKHSAV